MYAQSPHVVSYILRQGVYRRSTVEREKPEPVVWMRKPEGLRLSGFADDLIANQLEAPPARPAYWSHPFACTSTGRFRRTPAHVADETVDEA